VALPIKKQIDYALFLAAGQDDPHSVTITELCATIARLQEKVETLGKERDEARFGYNHQSELKSVAISRAEAAEAERDRLREALTEARELLAGPLVGVEWKRACYSFIAKADAALQKERANEKD
jgi:hypothetical protein